MSTSIGNRDSFFFTLYIRQAASENSDAAAMQAALSSLTDLSQAAITIVCDTFAKQSQAPQLRLNVPHLVNFEWNLAFKVASDSCSSLSAPYVGLMLYISDCAGCVVTKYVELSVPQFNVRYSHASLTLQEFAKAVKDAHTAMETM